MTQKLSTPPRSAENAIAAGTAERSDSADGRDDSQDRTSPSAGSGGLRDEDKMFLANMSHFVRTPLTSLLGFASVLAHELEGDHQRHARIIEKSARTVVDAMNAMLSYIDRDAATLKLSHMEVDVYETMAGVVRAMTARAEGKGIQLLSDGHDGGSLRAWADPDSLREVVERVVDNAIRYTDKGHVRIDAERVDDVVEISVEDTGCGIPDEFQSFLFQPFRQDKEATDVTGRGPGVGLFQARNLARAMHGDIRLLHTSSQGTAFVITIEATTVAGAPTHGTTRPGSG